MRAFLLSLSFVLIPALAYANVNCESAKSIEGLAAQIIDTEWVELPACESAEQQVTCNLARNRLIQTVQSTMAAIKQHSDHLEAMDAQCGTSTAPLAKIALEKLESRLIELGEEKSF